MAEDLSWAWSADEPPTAANAANELDTLEAQCTPTQRKNRDEAFPKARRYITSQAGRGADAPVSLTFQNRPPPKKATDARVDIEVIDGRAFT